MSTITMILIIISTIIFIGSFIYLIDKEKKRWFGYHPMTIIDWFVAWIICLFWPIWMIGDFVVDMKAKIARKRIDIWNKKF